MEDIPEVSKSERLEAPSGWLELTKDESPQLVIDALLSIDPAREFTKTELARISGVSTQSIRRHVDHLVDLGILTETAGGKRYRFDLESETGRLVTELNGALLAQMDGGTADAGADTELAEQ